MPYSDPYRLYVGLNYNMPETCNCRFCQAPSFNAESSYYDDDDYRDDDDDYSDDYYESDSGLLGYSYRPHFVFHKAAAKETHENQYYGVEFEHTCSSSRVARAVSIVREMAPRDLLYMKSDSTVYGYEMVTHPCTWDYFLHEFPWNLFDALNERCRISVDSESNGIHVHVARRNFVSPSHMYHFMKLFYRNEDAVIELAGRDSSWGTFSQEHKRSQFYHCKAKKTRRDENMDHTSYDRYSAINTQNRDTLELRLFASTTSPKMAKARIGLAASAVEYTQQLTAHSVSTEKGWEFGTFLKWVERQDGRFSDLEKVSKDIGLLR